MTRTTQLEVLTERSLKGFPQSKKEKGKKKGEEEHDGREIHCTESFQLNKQCFTTTSHTHTTFVTLSCICFRLTFIAAAHWSFGGLPRSHPTGTILCGSAERGSKDTCCRHHLGLLLQASDAGSNARP